MKYLRAAAFAATALMLAGCGYRVAGRQNALPPSVQTIAIPPFANNTTQFKVADRLTAAVTREMIERTRYRITTREQDADAILTGALVNFFSYPTTFDPATGRASGVQVIVQVQIRLRDKAGKILFERPNFEVRERYEISTDPKTYFDESGGAMERLSRDVARSIVSGILENF